MSTAEVSKFIAKCAAEGLSGLDEIKEKALERIREIDAVIAEGDKLRPERATMVRVLRSFGEDVPKASKKVVPTLLDESTIDDLDEQQKQLIDKICRYLEMHEAATPRELMTLCGVTVENDIIINSLIKWLCISGIATRRDTDRAVIKGPNWENRLPLGGRNV